MILLQTTLANMFASSKAKTRVEFKHVAILACIALIYTVAQNDLIFATSFCTAVTATLLWASFAHGIIQKRVYIPLFALLVYSIQPLYSVTHDNILYFFLLVLTAILLIGGFVFRYDKELYPYYVSKLVRKSKLAENTEAWPAGYEKLCDKAIHTGRNIFIDSDLQTIRLIECMAREQLTLNSRGPHSLAATKARNNLLAYKQQLAAL